MSVSLRQLRNGQMCVLDSGLTIYNDHASFNGDRRIFGNLSQNSHFGMTSVDYRYLAHKLFTHPQKQIQTIIKNIVIIIAVHTIANDNRPNLHT